MKQLCTLRDILEFAKDIPDHWLDIRVSFAMGGQYLTWGEAFGLEMQYGHDHICFTLFETEDTPELWYPAQIEELRDEEFLQEISLSGLAQSIAASYETRHELLAKYSGDITAGVEELISAALEAPTYEELLLKLEAGNTATTLSLARTFLWGQRLADRERAARG